MERAGDRRRALPSDRSDRPRCPSERGEDQAQADEAEGDGEAADDPRPVDAGREPRAELGARDRKYVVIRGDWEERFRAAVEHVERVMTG